MTRTYPHRGREVVVDEVEDVVLVPPSAAAPAGGEANEPAGTGVGRLVRRRLEAHRLAGWSARRAAPPSPEDALRLDRPWAGRLYTRRSDRSVAMSTGGLVVRLHDDSRDGDVGALFARRRLTTIRRLHFAPQLYIVVPADGRHPFDAAWELTREEAGIVKYAEPEFVERVPQRSNDPGFPAQWQWRNDGQSGGTPRADVRAEDAWRHTRGRGVVVAVIDKGFHLGTADLTPVDSAGRFREAGDFDAAFELTDDHPGDAHGTFCASLVTGAQDNGSAGCGIAPEAGLLPVTCLRDALGSQVTLARAIAYAVDPACEGHAGLTPAAIVSCSFGPDGGVFRMQGVLEDALAFARTGRGGLGVPVFWAVANEPERIALDEVNASGLTVPVGSSDDSDVRGDCGFGPELAFLAPGERVVGLLPDNTTGVMTGTSFAAPIAAGVAALVLSINPSLTAKALVGLLAASCDPGPLPTDANGRNDFYGHGRINAARAVNLALASLSDQGDRTA